MRLIDLLPLQDSSKSGFFITDCVNVEVRGPARAYHVDLPFTQGTITDISNDKSQGYYWLVQVSTAILATPGTTPFWSCSTVSFVVQTPSTKEDKNRGDQGSHKWSTFSCASSFDGSASLLYQSLVSGDPDCNVQSYVPVVTEESLGKQLLLGIAQIHDGFPDDRVVGPDGNTKGFLIRFDPQSLLLPDDYYDATFHSHEKLSTNPPTYKFKFDAAQPAGKVGDYVAVSPQRSAT